MANLVIRGGRPLNGSIVPSANKNAVLPILCATLLSRAPIRLLGVPDITDVTKILEWFRLLGSDVRLDPGSGTLDIHHERTRFDARSQPLPKAMRSSILLVPPLLARFGIARMENDVKGCTLGAREIDPHIELLRQFGSDIERCDDALIIRRPAPMPAVQHWLDYASVTTTENFVLCAVLAEGTSTLTNAACEPHVQEFCRFLTRLGARIEGIGTSRLTIHGVESLGSIEYRFEEDFHEAATFLALGAITGGEVRVKNSWPEQFPLIDKTFAKLGATIVHRDGWSMIRRGTVLRVQDTFTQSVLPKIEAAPWPYLPVDLLPIFIALGVCASGNMMYWNKVYDGAMGWSVELSKFGAHVFLADPHRLVTFGGKPLAAAEVESPYIIRVAIALFMVAASIDGESVINNATPIQRAHPRFVENLRSLGAQVEWRE
jgi:UDP-N-acetylglucosamine 1-carboxyvinyltransferase